VTRRSKPAQGSRHIWGVAGLYAPDDANPVGNTQPGQGQWQLLESAQAVSSSNPMQAMAMLETIRDYGWALEWAALIIDGEVIIPAGHGLIRLCLVLSQEGAAAPRV
jgi:hypothetical protein